MSRPIKFRGWDAETRVMKYPTTEDTTDDVTSASLLAAYHDGGLSKIMQYTGLKDKNGKEIYEGDMIQFHRAGKLITKSVEWDNEFAHFTWVVSNPLDIEVVGNIYQNP